MNKNKNAKDENLSSNFPEHSWAASNLLVSIPSSSPIIKPSALSILLAMYSCYKILKKYQLLMVKQCLMKQILWHAFRATEQLSPILGTSTVLEACYPKTLNCKLGQPVASTSHLSRNFTAVSNSSLSTCRTWFIFENVDNSLTQMQKLSTFQL